MRGYSPPMTDNAQVGAVRSNQQRFWFYGPLYYDDVFGNHRAIDSILETSGRPTVTAYRSLSITKTITRARNEPVGVF